MCKTSVNDLYMTVVAEIIWLKAEFIEVNHNSEDFSVSFTFKDLFWCVRLELQMILLGYKELAFSSP